MLRLDASVDGPLSSRAPPTRLGKARASPDTSKSRWRRAYLLIVKHSPEFMSSWVFGDGGRWVCRLLGGGGGV